MSAAAAVIADIHGNLPALEASLTRIGEPGIDRVYCGGDIVARGPHPNDVCRRIQESRIPTIYGNYDYALARAMVEDWVVRDPAGACLLEVQAIRDELERRVLDLVEHRLDAIRAERCEALSA